MLRNGKVLLADQILLLAVSGQRYTHRGDVFRGFQEDLPRIFPNQRFVFFDMLRELPLSCPLLWSEEEWGVDPRRRLLRNWGSLIQILNDRMKPQLQSGVILIAHGFGLNLLLNAAVTPEFNLQQEAIDQVYEAQGGLVKIFLRDICPPEYIIMNADPEAVSARMAREKPLLEAIEPKTRMKFIRFEEAAISEYFRRVPMQKTPHYIDGTLDPSMMRRRSIEIIGRRIREWQKAAA